MIRKVSFRNFKAYRSLDVELEPFTVLVGPNASGKTTLLEGLRLLMAAADVLPTMDLAMEERPGLLSSGAAAPVEVHAWGEWGGASGTLHLEGNPLPLEQAKGRRDMWGFRVSGEWNGVLFPIPRHPHGDRSEDLQKFSSFRDALRATEILHFESGWLAEPSYSETEVPVIESDGSGLASVLAHLKLSDDEAFVEIEESLRRIVPTVRRVRLERAAIVRTRLRAVSDKDQQLRRPEKSTYWGHRIVFDMQGAKGVPASSVGEGTLMALGLLAVLKGPARPRLVLLDDIELTLHPTAQQRLIEVLRATQRHDSDLQIVATSHSPFILNYLEPKEVRITALAEDGSARCVPMTSHPDFERWKDLMAPGEFWSTVGEDWVRMSAEAPSRE